MQRLIRIDFNEYDTEHSKPPLLAQLLLFIVQKALALQRDARPRADWGAAGYDAIGEEHLELTRFAESALNCADRTRARCYPEPREAADVRLLLEHALTYRRPSFILHALHDALASLNLVHAQRADVCGRCAAN